MNYFIEKGIDKDTVNSIYENYSEEELKELEYNRSNVVEVYRFFKNIGITEENIKELFLVDLETFYMNYREIKSKMEEYDLDKYIELLNDNIELIYKAL